MRVLPLCRHYYHPDCVAQWLSINKASRGWEQWASAGRSRVRNARRWQLARLPLLVPRHSQPAMFDTHRHCMFDTPSCRFAASAIARCWKKGKRMAAQRQQQRRAAACWASGGGSSM